MATVKADLVLRNGRIFLGLDHGHASALAVFRDRVLAVGDDAEIATLVGPATRLIDLDGRAATPGINDGHQHMLSVGMALEEVDLRPARVRTLDDVLAAIAAKIAASPPGAWIFGGRYDHFHLDIGRHPFREELDRVSPDNPVFIKRTCGHMGVANTRALAAAGIDEHAANPPGGNIERQNGRLTGLLQERAQELVSKVMPALPVDTLVGGIEAAGKLFLSQGITSVMDAAVGMRQGFDHYLAFSQARREGRMGVRVYLSFTGGPAGIEETALANGLVTGAGDEMLKAGSVKLFTDGSAGGRTAAMRDPYRCSCGNTGMLLYEDADLDAFVDRYNRAGWQVSIHAIGDAAIDQALDAIERADHHAPVAARRHRIEHCGFTTPDQIARMKRLGVIPAPQPIFIYEFGDLYIDVLGEGRPSTSYPMRTWMAEGMHPIASSDAPVCDSNPMKNLYTMLTRKSDRGTVLGAGEALSAEQAVSAMTFNGAYGSFSEHEKGTLAPGMLADIAVFDRDLFAVEPEAVLDAVADVTVVGGRVVHDRHGEVSG
ncbi:MAG: amidohydrolase family protein [Ectothiorhodospiraceae bacterium]|nr:amidohydrolase family protein [Chromatiales bacterium]MCP5153856.1 amidohydrolase family protein [Ectothiorhodospiraceae bacterium]